MRCTITQSHCVQFSSVHCSLFSVCIWFGLCWALSSFFDHYIRVHCSQCTALHVYCIVCITPKAGIAGHNYASQRMRVPVRHHVLLGSAAITFNMRSSNPSLQGRAFSHSCASRLNVSLSVTSSLKTCDRVIGASC